MANNIGVCRRMRPPHKVPSQLKVLMAEGTPMAIVIIENANAEYGLMPLMNMCCTHTMKPSSTIDISALAIAWYAKIGLRETVENHFEKTALRGKMPI